MSIFRSYVQQSAANMARSLTNTSNTFVLSTSVPALTSSAVTNIAQTDPEVPGSTPGDYTPAPQTCTAIDGNSYGYINMGDDSQVTNSAVRISDTSFVSVMAEKPVQYDDSSGNIYCITFDGATSNYYVEQLGNSSPCVIPTTGINSDYLGQAVFSPSGAHICVNWNNGTVYGWLIYERWNFTNPITAAHVYSGSLDIAAVTAPQGTPVVDAPSVPGSSSASWNTETTNGTASYNFSALSAESCYPANTYSPTLIGHPIFSDDISGTVNSARLDFLGQYTYQSYVYVSFYCSEYSGSITTTFFCAGGNATSVGTDVTTRSMSINPDTCTLTYTTTEVQSTVQNGTITGPDECCLCDPGGGGCGLAPCETTGSTNTGTTTGGGLYFTTGYSTNFCFNGMPNGAFIAPTLANMGQSSGYFSIEAMTATVSYYQTYSFTNILDWQASEISCGITGQTSSGSNAVFSQSGPDTVVNYVAGWRSSNGSTAFVSTEATIVYPPLTYNNYYGTPWTNKTMLISTTPITQLEAVFTEAHYEPWTNFSSFTPTPTDIKATDTNTYSAFNWDSVTGDTFTGMTYGYNSMGTLIQTGTVNKTGPMYTLIDYTVKG